MNLQNSRENEILNMLLNSSSYITTEKIASCFDVSKRTVQNDVDRLIRRIVDRGLQEKIRLEKKSGAGIRINAPNNCLELLGIELEKTPYAESNQYNLDRRIEVLNMLLNSDAELTLQFLADQFYTSKSVIARDLSWIEGWLANYNLDLTKARHKGINISGNEKDRRNAIVRLLVNSKTSDIFESGGMQKRLGADKYNHLQKTHSKISAEKLNVIIINTENEFNFSLSDEHYYSLLFHMLISIERLKHGNYISGGDESLYDQCGKEEMEIAECIAVKIEKEFNIAIPLEERIYICMHLMGSSIYNNTPSEGIKDSLANVPDQIQLLVNELVKYMGLVINENYEEDELLLVGLMLHLKMFIYRVKNGFVSNTFESLKVKPGYEVIYKAVWALGCLFEKHYKIKLSDEEICTISSYFILSVIRKRQQKKVVISSDGGIIEALDLSKMIIEHIPDLNIVDICSFYQLSIKNPSEYDLVISTRKMNSVDKETITVNPEIKEDIQKIISYLSNPKAEKKQMDIPYKRIGLDSKSGASLLADINGYLLSDNVACKIRFENCLLINDALWIKITDNDTAKAYIFDITKPVLVNGNWVKEILVGVIPCNDMDIYLFAMNTFLNLDTKSGDKT